MIKVNSRKIIMLVCFFLPWAWIFAFAYDTHTLAEACYLNALQDMESWVFMASTGLFLFVLISEDMQSLLKTNTDLTIAYEQTVQGWVNVLDLRHQETKNHTLRVTEMTVELAKLAGFTDQDELDRIKRGAILHDIGKVGIPDAILTKPGVLNDEEFECMKLHPEIAYDILSGIDFLRSCTDIPYCHHERWDGSGYPRGLKGKEIPRAARLFAIIDVWDALSSQRAYKAAWPEEKVLHYLAQQAGGHFDPEFVDLFLKNYKQLKERAHIA